MKITPGHGGTLDKMAKAIADHQALIKVMEQEMTAMKAVFIKLGIDLGGDSTAETAANIIDVDTTDVQGTEGTSTLRDTVVWDEDEEQWKFYAVLYPYPV